MIMWLHQTQSSLSLSIPPLSHYIVYHNVTSDGDQGITTSDTNVTINVSINNQSQPNVVYTIRVAAVNVIGQGSFSEITLREYNT